MSSGIDGIELLRPLQGTDRVSGPQSPVLPQATGAVGCAMKLG